MIVCLCDCVICCQNTFSSSQHNHIHTKMDNGDLRTYLRGASTVNIQLMLRMAVDISNGLMCLHAANIVHRDIAARNCLVDRNLRVKLGDMGMGR